MKNKKQYAMFLKLDKQIYRLLKVGKTQAQVDNFWEAYYISNPKVSGTCVVVYGVLPSRV